MRGLMQDWPLLTHTILDHAAKFHGDREIVSRSVEGPIHRTTYAEISARSRQLADALRRYGIAEGDVVASLAWNTWRHVELWYGAMGLGAVVHTVNPRLFPDQLDYIVNHGGGRLMFTDLTFLPLLEALAPKLTHIEAFIVLTGPRTMPETSLPGATDYETFIGQGDVGFSWPKLDENTACGLCYTSGTTGNPKGVLYSHRSNILHAMACAAPDLFGLRARDVLMPVVPMFHANAWATIFMAPMVGCKLVMPGAAMDGASLHQLLEDEQITVTAAVPTIWMMLLQHLEKTGGALPCLERVYIGGAACPEIIIESFEEKYGVEVFHAWGMTEMSPIGTAYSPLADTGQLDGAALRKLKLKQGRAPYSVDLRIADDDGNALPRDGKAFGHLQARGPAVVAEYYKSENETIIDDQGWFDTGDVSTIDADGFMEITDRAKDVIKSGGEWISTIALENITVGHPDVTEAAAIGVAHPKWGERPLLIVIARDQSDISRDDILEHLSSRIAKWWMPDDVIFVEEIPHTATGKINKLALRDKFGQHKLPGL
ncbi:MAG: long-chain-fatty-acid--CoA ligase [Hyphomicrobiales bacterium]